MSKLLGNIFKLAIGAGVVYVAYKVGESMGKDKNKNLLKGVKSEIDTEIELITSLIKELRDKPNKTKKDKDNLDLLGIKLKQLERKNDND
jgi:hypothetical protein